VILVLFVMSLLMLLVSLQGMGWLLLVRADPPIGSTAENCMVGSVAATMLLRRLKEVSGCSTSSSRK